MTKPSQPVVHTFRILIQFLIRDLVVPVDVADLMEAAVIKDIDLSHIS